MSSFFSRSRFSRSSSNFRISSWALLRRLSQPAVSFSNLVFSSCARLLDFISGEISTSKDSVSENSANFFGFWRFSLFKASSAALKLSSFSLRDFVALTNSFSAEDFSLIASSRSDCLSLSELNIGRIFWARSASRTSFSFWKNSFRLSFKRSSSSFTLKNWSLSSAVSLTQRISFSILLIWVSRTFASSVIPFKCSCFVWTTASSRTGLSSTSLCLSAKSFFCCSART